MSSYKRTTSAFFPSLELEATALRDTEGGGFLLTRSFPLSISALRSDCSTFSNFSVVS